MTGGSRAVNERCRQRVVFLALIVSLLVVGTWGQAIGQARRFESVRLYGRVQWVAAERMQLTTDCMFLEPCSSVSVNIDLRRLSPSDYRGVRNGSWVLVEGIVTHENARHRVVATSITLVEEWEAP